ncbi:Putative N-acetylglucosamine-6-phosphate deacetylase, metal-dependent hydrolase [Septoria linicola]|uniref:N-acetylglucosamine-6-phosphate deacetylase n=1 Tax=Septoria linicola TaxID=215465 RepID=A0A9Q9AIT8_9PEZI|nr:putative N-acetylglucosamine-6-phosphate deacetylase, metal-dependent hydrolase [Septoria linicola]USW47723.1 Putative N-acetylglucosamine-6-phosphate deacetylase, metal-dependent hydrolase [Septoria linicola]
MSFTTFFNARLCRNGVLVDGEQLVVCSETGLILPTTGYIGGDSVDLDGAIIAPGYLELQTNGVKGFHFTDFQDGGSYAQRLDEAARFMATTGVTAFYPTIPTVPVEGYKKILPCLSPRLVDHGASILGAHAEGPYLHASKKGAHTASLFQSATLAPTDVYGVSASESLKLVTVAPELPNSSSLIHSLTSNGTVVSLGHSSATYSQGLAALQAGASCLTHTLNAMAPLHHRDPGLAGLITLAPAPNIVSPYFSLIADGNHLHPSVVTLLYRSNPQKCILITDSIELLGLRDGDYSGNSQIDTEQTKIGSKVVKKGTDTLVGGCATLDLCVRNLVEWSGCSLAEAVRCVTENVVNLMGDHSRGKLEEGRRADLVMMNDDGEVLQTWVGGVKVWCRD